MAHGRGPRRTKQGVATLPPLHLAPHTDGGVLASVPERSGPDEDADAERNFYAAIDEVSDVFGRQGGGC